MDTNERIRTSRGQYPVSSVKQGYDMMTGDPCLRFEFLADATQTSSISHAPSAPSSIADVAYLVTDKGGREEVKVSQLVSLASKTGPLFGLPEDEAVCDWLAESFLAGTVLAIQGAINDSAFEGMGKGFGITGETLVSKLLVPSSSAKPFWLYSVDVPLPEGVTDSFFRGMPSFPFVRRSQLERSVDYVVLLLESESDYSDGFEGELRSGGGVEAGDLETVQDFHLRALLFSFGEDIAEADFAAVLETVELLDQAEASALSGKEEPDCLDEGLSGYGLSEGLSYEDSALSRKDAPHLQKLVHALMSLRLRGIGVDLFESSEEDAFMVFPSYASYLWYRLFAQLCNVELGLCEECGKRFVLTGHRGSKRKYCSEACKTKAKNARTGKARDDARSFFLDDGLSVEQVARAVYGWGFIADGKESDANLNKCMELVRKHLREFPLLKRMIDASLKEGVNSELVVRCIEEGVFSWSYVFERAEKVGTREGLREVVKLLKRKGTASDCAGSLMLSSGRRGTVCSSVFDGTQVYSYGKLRFPHDIGHATSNREPH